MKRFFVHHCGYPMTSLGNVIAYVVACIIWTLIVIIVMPYHVSFFAGLIALSTVMILLSLPDDSDQKSGAATVGKISESRSTNRFCIVHMERHHVVYASYVFSYSFLIQ